MGIMDVVTSAVEQFGGGGQHAQVAGGLVQEIQEQPGGIGGVFQAFQQNGMGDLVQHWAGGQTAPASPDQIEQGLAGTGLIDRIAQRTGVSPGMVKTGLAVLVPIVIHHFVSKGHVTPDGQSTGTPPPETDGLLQSILGRLL